MAKDREEKYQKKTIETYAIGDEKPISGAHIRHPNRNINKGKETGKERNDKSNRSIEEIIADHRSGILPEELPGVLYKSLFADLANFQSEHCISVYLPTHRSSSEMNDPQDLITFKNKLAAIRSNLQQKGLNHPFIEKIMEPAFSLVKDEQLWSNLTEGLAMFMSEGFFKYIKLRQQPEEVVIINHSFHVSPLISAMTINNDHFYLLLISKKRAKLFRADQFYIEHIPIDEMPDGVEDVVHFEEKDDQNLFRMAEGGAGANFHGIGAGKPDPKENIALYLKEVDRTLHEKVLAREQAPLLVAGVDYIVPIFKQVSGYRFIYEHALLGHYENEPSSVLYAKSMEIMQPWFNRRHEEALEKYCNNLATPLTSSMPETVIPASFYSRVSDLFLCRGEHIWGSFDREANQLTMHANKEDNDDCLLDKAAVQTILNGGEVHILEKEKMPKGSTIAALMRY
jgi:hypothetical protein